MRRLMSSLMWGPIARLAAAIVALTGFAMISTNVTAQQPKAVKIAVIVPLSGAWARQGQLVKMGAETAVNEINAVFQSSPPAGVQSTEAVPTIVELGKAATGKPPKTAGIIGDNTASPVSFLKPMREGGLEKLGMKVVLDETYTPPLSDATPLIQKVRSTRPEFLLFISSTISDLKLGLEKMNEFHLAKGAIPVIGNGAHMGAPEVVKNVPPELLEGVMFIVANWGLKGQERISDLYKKQTGEPWITQDGLAGYGHTWILKEALERAGKADKVAVNEQIHKMELKSGPAADAFPGVVKFDENGRRVGAPLVIVQWQSGVPVSVFPTDRALAKAKWPKS